jgi:hypothetical protein
MDGYFHLPNPEDDVNLNQRVLGKTDNKVNLEFV